jgi:hypothetical protein
MGRDTALHERPIGFKTSLKHLPFQNPHYRTPGFAMRD